MESLREEGLTGEGAAETLFVLGCYVGEVMSRALAGRWTATARSPLAGISPWPMVVVLRDGSAWDTDREGLQAARAGRLRVHPRVFRRRRRPGAGAPMTARRRRRARRRGGAHRPPHHRRARPAHVCAQGGRRPWSPTISTSAAGSASSRSVSCTAAAVACAARRCAALSRRARRRRLFPRCATFVGRLGRDARRARALSRRSERGHRPPRASIFFRVRMTAPVAVERASHLAHPRRCSSKSFLTMIGPDHYRERTRH